MTKPRSAKQLANDQRLRDAAKKRKEENKKLKEEVQQETINIQKKTEPEANADLNTLIKQIEELKDNPLIQALFNKELNKEQNNDVNVGERKTGVFTKYITDPAQYPDPRERLFDFFNSQPKYRRFGLQDRYELRWEVGSMVPYERKDGILETQPRFVVGIDAIIFDEETYEPTDGRYVVKEFMFFEDPQTNVIVARENGIPVDESTEKAFMDEMRFIRVRDWLIDLFLPGKIDKTNKNRKDMVINGKQVQYYEISSTESETIPFDQLNTKIKG